MEQLLNMLNGWFPMSPELQVTLLHRVKKEIHRKNKYILEAGEICDWVAFIEQGICKTIYEPEDGAERIIGFFREGDIMGSMKSFYQFVPSKISIRTIQETHLRKIQKADLEAIYDKYAEFNINSRKIIEQYFGLSEDQMVFLRMPPKQRFLVLQREQPELFTDSRIKDYMLAAYLGIDKATLSGYRRISVKHPNQLSFFDL